MSINRKANDSPCLDNQIHKWLYTWYKYQTWLMEALSPLLSNHIWLDACRVTAVALSTTFMTEIRETRTTVYQHDIFSPTYWMFCQLSSQCHLWWPQHPTDSQLAVWSRRNHRYCTTVVKCMLKLWKVYFTRKQIWYPQWNNYWKKYAPLYTTQPLMQLCNSM